VPELAEHDVKRGGLKREILDVTLVPVDVDAGHQRVLSRAREEFRREIKASDAGAQARGRYSDDACSTGDVEHALAGLYTGVPHQPRCWWRRNGFKGREVRPPLLLRLLELNQRVHNRFHRESVDNSIRICAAACQRVLEAFTEVSLEA
jgi:hypothetical protein